jgi:hypothetical protein
MKAPLPPKKTDEAGTAAGESPNSKTVRHPIRFP